MPTKKSLQKIDSSHKTSHLSEVHAKAVDTGPHDSIAENRRLPVVPAVSIPRATPGFVPTPNEERARRLTRPAETLRAELVAALDEVIARKATYRDELGDLAPDPGLAETLRPRLASLRESVQAADALAACLHELEEIAYSDTAEFVQAVTEEVEHRSLKKPELKLAYSRVLSIAEQRRQLITEGMARARDRKDSSTPTP